MQPESERLQLSEFQERVLALPETFDLFLGGGRGGGKSYCLALLALRHAEQHGPNARVLYLRQSYPGVADFEQITRDLFGQAYGTAASFNGSSHTWRLPGGCYFELNQMESPKDYGKYQGRSFSLLLIDEAGQWSDPALIDLLRSNLRGSEGVPVRVVIAGNPGGPGHQWLARRYVFRSAPWQPFHEESSKREWIYCPSLYRENAFIDREGYRRQIEAACASDPELARAWLEGDWTVARGAYFAGCLSEERNAISNWEPGSVDPKAWNLYLSYDHGSSAPAACYIVARSPGAMGPEAEWFPRDSILLLDELATNEPGSLTRGMGYTVPRVAEEIRDLAERWRMRPEGCADDAIFARHGSDSGTIADEFRRSGVHFYRAKKGDRVHGWEVMRRILADAGKPDVPGLYVARCCEYFWQTVPYLARDPRRPDDVDSRGPDHGADAVRMAVGFQIPRLQLVNVQLG